jgi:hypothetical protein
MEQADSRHIGQDMGVAFLAKGYSLNLGLDYEP